MFDILNSFVRDARTLVQNVIIVMALIFIGWTWWRTKALTSTLGALLFAAVIIYGVHNVRFLSDVVDKDVRDRAPAARGADPRSTGR